MTTAGELRSGKGHRDENFPVASWLIDARHRGIILAFYEFVRIADDIADHATLRVDEKLAQLNRLEQNLLGDGESGPIEHPSVAEMFEDFAEGKYRLRHGLRH
jgi:phytoene/squalene synthetase